MGTMTNEDEKAPEKPRKPYAKPELFVFPLRPAEAVLGACKMATGGGVGAVGCANDFGPCSSLAS